MSDISQNTFDAGQFLSTAAKNYAELAGDAALKAGTAVKVVSASIAGKTLVFGVIADITLNDEPIDQALVSQITEG
ncbi:MAG: hypothetical protein OEY01_16740 [Desulfobulbaceae bacterium]|nr:hypothetical protein [Desulfobulbaceae bacterium]